MSQPTSPASPASPSAGQTTGQPAGPRGRGVADIVFLLDVTGSMQPCIDALKANISKFVDHLTTKDANNSVPVSDWRAKVVGYRDYEFDQVPFVDAPFVRDPAILKAQLGALVAEGGHDEPESLLDALYKVATMGQTERPAAAAGQGTAPGADAGQAGAEDPFRWRARGAAARVVVVFTDATFKEPLLLPEARGGGFDDVVNAVTANRVLLSIFAPDLPCFDRLASIDKSEYEAIPLGDHGPQQALAQFTGDTRNFQNALKQLAASVSKSAVTELL